MAAGSRAWTIASVAGVWGSRSGGGSRGFGPAIVVLAFDFDPSNPGRVLVGQLRGTACVVALAYGQGRDGARAREARGGNQALDR